jgi:hypothetical protein
MPRPRATSAGHRVILADAGLKAMSLDKAKAMRELSPSYELAGASRGQARFTTRLP